MTARGNWVYLFVFLLAGPVAAQPATTQPEPSAEAKQIRELETRLTAALRDAYLRQEATERDATLVRYLTDPLVVVRQLGLELVQATVAEGNTPSAELRAAMRVLLHDADAVIRSIAAEAVAGEGRSEDENTFLTILENETDSAVQRALINGLGYVGSGRSVARLLIFVTVDDLDTADEAVGGLGRLAERQVLTPDELARIAPPLLDRYKLMRGRNGHEARVLWAMGHVADERFVPVLISAAAESQAPGTRLAALRSLANLSQREPPLEQHAAVLRAIAARSDDPDLSTRRVAAETLAQVGTQAELPALCDRLDPENESDDAIRAAAWDGAARLLAEMKLPELQPYVEKLPEPLLNAQQRSQLLGWALAALGEDADAALRGQWRAEQAPLLVQVGRLEEALLVARGGLGDLHHAGATDLEPTASLILDLSLQAGTYNEAIAGELNAANPLLNLDTLWAARCQRIGDLLKAPTARVAVDMLTALDTHPPEKLGDASRATVKTLQREAERIIREDNERLVRDSLAVLRERPDDEKARQAILTLGGTAIPELRNALKQVLTSEVLDTEAERRIHDLLKQVQPSWVGFDPDASREDKLGTLE